MDLAGRKKVKNNSSHPAQPNPRPLLPRWLIIFAVLFVLILLVALLAAEVAMNTAFGEEAVRAGVKAEFNSTKECLFRALAPYEISNSSNRYTALIAGHLVGGINTSEIFVREVRRDGWAYRINTTVRYPDLPLPDSEMDLYVSIFGERRIIGPVMNMSGKFGTECIRTCGDNLLIFDKEKCHSACGTVGGALADSNCMPKSG